jgi:hypothetical protein
MQYRSECEYSECPPQFLAALPHRQAPIRVDVPIQRTAASEDFCNHFDDYAFNQYNLYLSPFTQLSSNPPPHKAHPSARDCGIYRNQTLNEFKAKADSSPLENREFALPILPIAAFSPGTLYHLKVRVPSFPSTTWERGKTIATVLDDPLSRQRF